MSAIEDILRPVPVPKVMKVIQRFEGESLPEPGASFLESLHSSGVMDRVSAGASVAITAGSRGITDLPAILSILVQELRRAGARPFLVPAMGSHGGATAEGQRALLDHMGITEKIVGAPIRASMDVVQIGTTESGLPVFIDSHAHAADGIIVVNRIKPHVAFRGDYESGLMKMIAIGLGKRRGADMCHDLGFGLMARNVLEVGRTALRTGRFLFAVGVVENAWHRTHHIEVMPAEAIESREPALLRLAWERSAKLCFDNLDVLVIDEIGKDISGTGFDFNVVGRYHTPYASGGPSITRIAVLDLTERTAGNANGVGVADFTTRRLFSKMDFHQTYPNSLTSTVPTSVKIPMILENDRNVIQAAIKTCNIKDKHLVRLVRIRNTLELGTIEASEALRDEIEHNPALEAASDPYELPFDPQGNLR